MTIQELVNALKAEQAQAVTIFQNGRAVLLTPSASYAMSSVAELEKVMGLKVGPLKSGTPNPATPSKTPNL